MRRVEAVPISRRDWIREHPVLAFYLLTFGLEFGSLLALLAFGISLSATIGRVAVMVALHTNGSLFIAWLLHFAINVSSGALGLAEGAVFPLFVVLNVGLALVIAAAFGPRRLARDHQRVEREAVSTEASVQGRLSPASLRGAWHGLHHD
jgi:hypothetical protein